MPNFNSAKSSAGLCRITTIVLGVVILGVGLHSHFQSAWVKTLVKLPIFGEIKPYQICQGKNNYEKCPPIELERFYISTILVCFLVSLFGLILSVLIDMGNSCIRLFDTVYHLLAALFLIAAAVAYVVSAEQINAGIAGTFDSKNFNFRRTEKLVAAGLTVLQGVIYFTTGIVIVKS